MEKAVVLLSGGMDSLTCASIALNNGYDVHLLHVNYKQQTEERELQAFKDIAEFYAVPEEKRLITNIDYLSQIGGSSLTDPDIQVTEANLDSDEIPSSVVPYRNASILSIATSWSIVLGASKIYAGVVEEDSSGYRDCSEEFIRAFNRLIIAGTSPRINGTGIEIITPVIHMTKRDIIEIALARGAPLNLSWSCYRSNGPKACGICDSCALRLKGFREVGFSDPIQYEDDSVRTKY